MMEFERYICSNCDKDRPCILNIPKDSSATPVKCPLSSDDIAKSNWRFNSIEDDKKIVNVILTGVTKFSYDGHINVEIPDDVIINFEMEK